MDEFIKYLQSEHPDSKFTSDEIDAGLEKMTDLNQIMVADKMIFLI